MMWLLSSIAGAMAVGVMPRDDRTNSGATATLDLNDGCILRGLRRSTAERLQSDDRRCNPYDNAKSECFMKAL